jgi:glucosamine 6-phosphate synthetase-like amidotransferase/phosphosugar isomerase protein
MTHTYALLPVSPAVYEEIARKLREAGYSHAFNAEGEIDMHGIALVADDGPQIADAASRAKMMEAMRA